MHSDNQHWQTEVCLSKILNSLPPVPVVTHMLQSSAERKESAWECRLFLPPHHHPHLPQSLLSLSHHLLPLFLPSSGERCNWYATGNKSAQLQGRAVTIIWTDRFSCFERKGEGERVYPAQLAVVTYSLLLYQGLDFSFAVDIFRHHPLISGFPVKSNKQNQAHSLKASPSRYVFYLPFDSSF